MTQLVRTTLKVGNSMWELFASATGGFMFVRGFSLVSEAGGQAIDVVTRDRSELEGCRKSKGPSRSASDSFPSVN